VVGVGVRTDRFEPRVAGSRSSTEPRRQRAGRAFCSYKPWRTRSTVRRGGVEAMPASIVRAGRDSPPCRCRQRTAADSRRPASPAAGVRSRTAVSARIAGSGSSFPAVAAPLPWIGKVVGARGLQRGGGASGAHRRVGGSRISDGDEQEAGRGPFAESAGRLLEVGAGSRPRGVYPRRPSVARRSRSRRDAHAGRGGC